MAKVGDTVRYLNDIGGGVIKRIEGKLAYVEEDGFETPVLLKELVVVLPAGHTPQTGAKLMFDQAAFDKGKKAEAPVQKVEISQPEPELPLMETLHGEKLNITLAFEPADPKALSKTTFNAVLVNDSNYILSFTFLSRSEQMRDWKLVYNGEVMPNELIDLAQYTHQSIGEIERVALQCIAYKKDKNFELKAPLNSVRKIDLTKFHKLHCFRTGLYFDTPVLEFPLITDDRPVKSVEQNIAVLKESLDKNPPSPKEADRLKEKYAKNIDKPSPHKLLPLIVKDLHINELLDNTAGMEPKDILQYQMDTIRKVLGQHSKRKGQKLVFIHGKGEGVLRKALWDLLKKEYPKYDIQDASFKEYGFGAALVTIH